MVDAAPFRGLRYDPSVAGPPVATSAPPYDDIDAYTYASHRTASPYTVLELLTPPTGHRSYQGAADVLRRWQRTGVVVPDAEPALYRYEEHELRHGRPTVQRGLLASVALEPPGPGSAVLTHEDVQPERVADRRARLEQVAADLSPVFALSTGSPVELHALLSRPPPARPVIAFTDGAGVDHRVWAVTGAREIEGFCRALGPVRVLVADGHHRYAAALAARAGHAGAGWRRTLMYVVDGATVGPQVLGVHRLVHGVTAAAVRRLDRDFVVEPGPGDPRILRDLVDAAEGTVFGLLLSPRLAATTKGTVLRARDGASLAARLPADRSPLWRSLAPALLDHAILPGLGGTVAYRADLVAAAASVAAGDDAALFVLPPVDVRTAVTLAVRGEHLPAKSTYFRPKPRAGLVMRLLDDPPDDG